MAEPSTVLDLPEVVLPPEQQVSVPPDILAAVSQWILRLSNMFRSKLKGLPPGTETLPLSWHFGEVGKWGAVYYDGMDEEEEANPSPFYFGFSGEGSIVTGISIQQRGRWIGVHVRLLEHLLAKSRGSQKYGFGELASILEKM